LGVRSPLLAAPICRPPTHTMNSVCRRIPLIAGCLMAFPLLALAAPELHRTSRSDGSTIHWYLDRPPGATKTGLIVLAQGSGCLSVAHNANLSATRSAFAGVTAITVEKYGVTPGDRPRNDHGDCSREFREHHTVAQRVADYQQIISTLRAAPWWNGNLVLFGCSEGGLVAGILAERVKAKATVLLSSRKPTKTTSPGHCPCPCPA